MVGSTALGRRVSDHCMVSQVESCLSTLTQPGKHAHQPVQRLHQRLLTLPPPLRVRRLLHGTFAAATLPPIWAVPESHAGPCARVPAIGAAVGAVPRAPGKAVVAVLRARQQWRVRCGGCLLCLLAVRLRFDLVGGPASRAEGTGTGNHRR